MFFVPLYIEILRSRPLLLFWLAALTQAAVWVAVPMLFYAAPPGDLPQLLAIGHEFQLHAPVGPPLAYWIAELAFRAAGLFGVYALSQLCVVVTYWCVFALGRAIVGPPQAAMAVLLMVGISLFTVPTPEFGPPILAMVLWALVLLFYWQAAMLSRRWCWYAFGVAAAPLLLTSEAALILLGTLLLYIAVTVRGRATLSNVDPWIVGIALVPFLFVHLLWLMGMDISLAPAFDRLHDAAAGRDNTFAWLRLLAVLALAHAGLVILVVMASGWPRTSANPAPTITRTRVDSDAVTFVKVIALVPAMMATIIAVLLGQRTPFGGAAPLVVLSALAVIVVAGDSIEVFHQRVLGYAWAGLLIVPALFVPAVLLLLPWAATELRVEQPAKAMGRFFADSFERRTGRPLAVVTGDPSAAMLIALAAPSRPSVYNAVDPARSPWVTPDDIRQKGAIVVWLTSDTTPTPPPEIREHFPDLVPEVPRAFDRPIQGRLPTLRVGWGVIRPGSVASAQ
jgi:4-amino-4-deoxy-L-arabinose transferase-like glycosyltransferase